MLQSFNDVLWWQLSEFDYGWKIVFHDIQSKSFSPRRMFQCFVEICRLLSILCTTMYCYYNLFWSNILCKAFLEIFACFWFSRYNFSSTILSQKAWQTFSGISCDNIFKKSILLKKFCLLLQKYSFAAINTKHYAAFCIVGRFLIFKLICFDIESEIDQLDLFF